jgi:hypothetical protein
MTERIERIRGALRGAVLVLATVGWTREQIVQEVDEALAADPVVGSDPQREASQDDPRGEADR